MSEHGHDEHGHPGPAAQTQGTPNSHADVHGGHGADAHDDHGGHGDHGDHVHAGGWGDYNSQAPAASILPPVPRWGLAVMGFVLALLMGVIVYASLALAAAEGSAARHGEGHDESPDGPGVHHLDKKAEH